MIDPSGFFRFLWDTLSDPAQRTELLNSVVIFLALYSPIMLTSFGLRRYAARHGRTTKRPRELRNNFAPFVEPRLNEAYAVIRRVSMPLGFAILMAGMVAGIALSSDAVGFIAAAVAYFVIFTRQMFIEACLAFGAEPAPAPNAQTRPAT